MFMFIHAEMSIEEEHTGGVAEPIAPGMTLPREKRKKKERKAEE